MQKLNSINRSHYLSTVYYDALQCAHETLTIYGCSFSENDDHLLSVLKTKGFSIKRIAISVYEKDEEARKYCEHVIKRIHDVSGRYDIDIVFYKSDSLGCWIN
ncbi:DUF4917 family protein [Dickeya zeae]|uniref:DUF4917 family protein n=1 Tax=Dickeya zeae TaxID=204042 RepID=UPI0018AD338D|nr:DUF4917 family protein [Dickeya zeae]